MRKILLSALLFFCVAGLFALDYPVLINNGTILINTGVGFGLPLTDKVKKEERIGSDQNKCPPLTASFDFALPIAGLPFTFGLIIGIKTESAWWYNNTDKEERNDRVAIMPIGARIAYHLPFDIPKIRFDSYALLTFGWSVFFYKDEFLIDAPPPDPLPNPPPDPVKATPVTRKFWWGIGGGARYFFLPYMGAYLEFGIGRVQNITFGLSFKM